MKTKTIKISALFLLLVTVMVLYACTDTNQNSQKLYNGAELTSINFGSDNITVNGKSVGNDSYNAVYTSKDIIYYENL
ncbi:MAG: hypothetical protein IJD67_03650 [Clostridia bacterium]|nr:hypothetical protein [Clostridia bacterium]